MSVHYSFNETAGYQEFRSALIPDHDDFYGAALAALPQNRRKPYRILELGAGTGAFTEQVARAYPHAQVFVSDISATMLDRAKTNLRGAKRFNFQLLDMLLDPLPQEMDVVVSTMAVHCLDHADKRFVFSKICAALNPGGRFVNADQVSSGDQRKDQRAFDKWLEDVRAGGVSERELKRTVSHMRDHDQNAPRDLQVRWLREAGFAKVRVSYENYFWAVFKATK